MLIVGMHGSATTGAEDTMVGHRLQSHTPVRSLTPVANPASRDTTVMRGPVLAKDTTLTRAHVPTKETTVTRGSELAKETTTAVEACTDVMVKAIIEREYERPKFHFRFGSEEEDPVWSFTPEGVRLGLRLMKRTHLVTLLRVWLGLAFPGTPLAEEMIELTPWMYWSLREELYRCTERRCPSAWPFGVPSPGWPEGLSWPEPGLSALPTEQCVNLGVYLHAKAITIDALLHVIRIYVQYNKDIHSAAEDIRQFFPFRSDKELLENHLKFCDLCKPEGITQRDYFSATVRGISCLRFMTIVTRGKLISERRHPYGWSLLTFPTQMGNLNVIRYIVEVLEADHLIYMRDRNGSTILHVAAYCGQLEVIRYYVEERGASGLIEGRSEFGRTVLHAAALWYEPSILRYFVEERGCGHLLSAKDDDGCTAADVAKRERFHNNNMEYLLKVQESCGAVSSDSRRPAKHVASTSAARTPIADTSVASTTETSVASTPSGTTVASTTETSVTGASVASTSTARNPVASASSASITVANPPSAGTTVASTSVANTSAGTGTPVASAPVVNTPLAGTPVASTPSAGTTVASAHSAGIPVASTPVASTPVAGTTVANTLPSPARTARPLSHGAIRRILYGMWRQNLPVPTLLCRWLKLAFPEMSSKAVSRPCPVGWSPDIPWPSSGVQALAFSRLKAIALFLHSKVDMYQLSETISKEGSEDEDLKQIGEYLRSRLHNDAVGISSGPKPCNTPPSALVTRRDITTPHSATGSDTTTAHIRDTTTMLPAAPDVNFNDLQRASCHRQKRGQKRRNGGRGEMRKMTGGNRENTGEERVRRNEEEKKGGRYGNRGEYKRNEKW
eukprot:Rmarinus@m.24522